MRIIGGEGWKEREIGNIQKYGSVRNEGGEERGRRERKDWKL